jgi:peptidoglycan hydrolase-like protein with peptidoglycan-binding domain
VKQYNNSDLYALYVGHLADRFADDRPLRARWSPVGGFSRGDIRAVQEKLVAQGYDVGGADGLVGYKTRIAIGRWQERHGLPATCLPDAALVARLR